MDGASIFAQVGYLGLALLLSSLIGLEREFRGKSAGLRTNALVGLGAALFVVVSKYGFSDVLGQGARLDPSRLAAQIVTGIGFIGGGIIFVHRTGVRGVTTAAVIWLTAAVGTAAGAGLVEVAAVVTGAYFVIALLYPLLVGRIRRTRTAPWQLHLDYIDGRGVLRRALMEASRRGFEIGELAIERERVRQAPDAAVLGAAGGQSISQAAETRETRLVSVTVDVEGKQSIGELTDTLASMDGMVSVRAEDPREEAA